jgi:hypothetical protein
VDVAPEVAPEPERSSLASSSRITFATAAIEEHSQPWMPPMSARCRPSALPRRLFSFSTADERLHAPDEFFRLSRLEEGVAAWSELWRLGGPPG